MNNTQVAEAFNNGAESGKGSNMFIEGNTIYSYGYHFPIATRIMIKDVQYYLFNKDGYSNTTAKHKGHVRRYLNENQIIEIDDLKGFSLKDNIINQIDLNNKEIENLNLKLKNARVRKNYYQEMIDNINIQNGKLATIGLIFIDDKVILKSNKSALEKMRMYADKLNVVKAMSVQ